MREQTLGISSKYSIFSLKWCLQPRLDIVTSPHEDLCRPVLEDTVPTALQVSKVLPRLLSEVPPKFEFERPWSEGLQGMHEAFLPHSWHNPILTCFQAVYGGSRGQWFISRDSLMKLKWPRNNQAQSWRVWQRKSKVWCFLYSEVRTLPAFTDSCLSQLTVIYDFLSLPGYTSQRKP